MNDLLEKADEMPVTLVLLLGFVTMAFLTDPISPSGDALRDYGWLTAAMVSEGEWWRLFSSSLLHGGLLHLVLNTGALISLGPTIERTFGSARFALLYVVAELGSSVAVCFANDPHQPVVGASGALFGMMGAVVAWQMQHGRNALSFLDYDGPRRLIGTIAVYLVIGAFVPFISNTGHVGGLLAGFAVTFLFLTPQRDPGARLQSWRAAFVTLMLGLTFYSLLPVTRWDWLLERGNDAMTRVEQERWRRLATMSYWGRSDVRQHDWHTFEALELLPKPKPR